MMNGRLVPRQVGKNLLRKDERLSACESIWIYERGLATQKSSQVVLKCLFGIDN